VRSRALVSDVGFTKGEMSTMGRAWWWLLVASGMMSDMRYW
jgi:hypothetical protein